MAPSLWVVAPVLPGSAVAREATTLFALRGAPDQEARISELKLVTPNYQHVDGTSFAAPIAAATVAAMLEANPHLTPRLVRELLIRSAHPVPGAPPERQGAGALDAGRAVALAVLERHGWDGGRAGSAPRVGPPGRGGPPGLSAPHGIGWQGRSKFHSPTIVSNSLRSTVDAEFSTVGEAKANDAGEATA